MTDPATPACPVCGDFAAVRPLSEILDERMAQGERAREAHRAESAAAKAAARRSRDCDGSGDDPMPGSEVAFDFAMGVGAEVFRKTVGARMKRLWAQQGAPAMRQRHEEERRNLAAMLASRPVWCCSRDDVAFRGDGTPPVAVKDAWQLVFTDGLR